MKKKAIVESAVGWLLSGTQVAFDGLSSARQIVDFTSAPWAKYAACGATIVEGEIYRKNIVEGFSRFNLLSKKSLREYLIIEKFEVSLFPIEEKYEKEIKANIDNFLIEINKKYKLDELDEEENRCLDECNELLKKEGSLRNIDNKNKVKEYFENFKSRRFSTSSFVFDHHLDQFEILNKEFEKLLEAKRNSFLISYRANQQFLKLKQTGLSEEEKSDAEEAKNRLKFLRKMLIKQVIDHKNDHFLDDTISPALTSMLKEELDRQSVKLWPLRFGMLFSVGVGLGAGVITFYTFPAVLVGLGLTSLTILSAVIWPLAILAAISYAILIYNTVTDLILNETLSKWWKELNTEIREKYGDSTLIKYIFLVIGKSISQCCSKLIHWLRPQEKENYFSYAFRILLSAAVLVFGIIASLTTGYTAFIQLQDYVGLTACIITALPLMLSDLLFTLKNSFETVGLLTGISLANLLNPVNAAYINLKKQVAHENYLQCALHLLRLPLKLLLSVLKLFIFCFHVFFTSVASDRFFNFPCWLTLFFAAGSELLTDICPIFGDKQGEHHDHDHGGIFNWIANVIFIIPATVLGIVNCLLSQLNYIGSNSDIKVLTLSEAIKQEWQQFHIMHVHDHLKNESVCILNKDDQKLPEDIVRKKAINICDKQVKRLQNGFFNSTLASEKEAIFIGYRKQLEQTRQKSSDSSYKLSDEEKQKLAKYRFFGKGKTESSRKIAKIEALLSTLATNNDVHVAANACLHIK